MLEIKDPSNVFKKCREKNKGQIAQVENFVKGLMIVNIYITHTKI